MVKEKPAFLPPSLRPSRRYIVYEVVSDEPVDYNELMNSMWYNILEFLGELKGSELDIWIMKNLYDSSTQTGLIRCNHDQVEFIRAALAMIQEVGETKAIVRVKSVTGTIKSAKKNYLGFTDLTDFERPQQ